MSNNTLDKGLKIRKEVLGDDYVNQAMENGWDFAQDFQEMVTRQCWGETWGREGLSRQQRSLLALSMTAALNRENEFETHLRGAIRNGCTPIELKELCIQVSTYCGVPAAVSCFRSLRKVLEELDLHC